MQTATFTSLYANATRTPLEVLQAECAKLASLKRGDLQAVANGIGIGHLTGRMTGKALAKLLSEKILGRKGAFDRVNA